MKKIIKILLVIFSFAIMINFNNVYADEGKQQKVYTTDMVVGTYGTITMSFMYNYYTATQEKEFVEWTYYRVKPTSASTCWYITRDVVKNGKGLKMTVSAQGYNYNTRVTSSVYKFVFYI